MVTRADIADVYIFDGTEGIVFPVAPDENTWSQIRAAWDEFAKYVEEKQAPPLTDRDTRIRDDPEWLSAAAAYLELRAAHEVLSAKVDEARDCLTSLTAHAREEGGGLVVTRFWKRGSVDYSAYRNSPTSTSMRFALRIAKRSASRLLAEVRARRSLIAAAHSRYAHIEFRGGTKGAPPTSTTFRARQVVELWRPEHESNVRPAP
jgi:hypothetical protein